MTETGEEGMRQRDRENEREREKGEELMGTGLLHWLVES